MQSALRIALLGLGCLGMLSGPRLGQASEGSDSIQNYLAGKPDLILCLTYSMTRSDSLREELTRRKLLNAEDMKAFLKPNPRKSSNVREGMSECGVLAVGGTPLRIARSDEPGVAEISQHSPPRAGSFDLVYVLDTGEPALESYAFIRGGIVMGIGGVLVELPPTPLRARY